MFSSRGQILRASLPDFALKNRSERREGDHSPEGCPMFQGRTTERSSIFAHRDIRGHSLTKFLYTFSPNLYFYNIDYSGELHLI